MERNTEANGYVILSIHEGDPDFDVVGGLYSPLSERTLAISGQKGLKPGDVILGVNGESGELVFKGDICGDFGRF